MEGAAAWGARGAEGELPQTSTSPPYPPLGAPCFLPVTVDTGAEKGSLMQGPIPVGLGSPGLHSCLTGSGSQPPTWAEGRSAS